MLLEASYASLDYQQSFSLQDDARHQGRKLMVLLKLYVASIVNSTERVVFSMLEFS